MRFSIVWMAALSLLVASAAWATPSRVIGLGDMALYVDDDTNVLRYPGLLSRNTNFVYIDLGGTTGLRSGLTGIQGGELNGGAFLRLSESFQLGVVASDHASSAGGSFLTQVANAPDAPNKTVFDGLAAESALRRYDVLLGFRASEAFAAGLRVAYGSNSATHVPDSKAKTTPSAPDKEPGPRLRDRKGQSHLQLTGGVSGQVGDATYYDVGVEYGYYGFTYDKNETYAFVAGGHEVRASARARFVLSKFWDLVPQLTYQGTFFDLVEDGVIPAFGSASNDEFAAFPDGASREHGRSRHVVDGGVAGALRASDIATVWLAAGVHVQSTGKVFKANKIAPKRDEESSSTLYSLPYVRAGVEGTPFEWLQLRLGVEKFAWRASTSDYVVDKDAEKDARVENSGAEPIDVTSDFEAYVGASFLLKGFQLDLLLDKEFFKRGPAVLSGSAGDWSGRASLSYRF